MPVLRQLYSKGKHALEAQYTQCSVSPIGDTRGFTLNSQEQVLQQYVLYRRCTAAVISSKMCADIDVNAKRRHWKVPCALRDEPVFSPVSTVAVVAAKFAGVPGGTASTSTPSPTTSSQPS